MSAHDMQESVVRGALASHLRIVRVVGMLPVRLVPFSDAFVVRYSLAQDVIARLFYGCFCISMITLEFMYLIPQLLTNLHFHKLVMMLSLIVAAILRAILLFLAVSKGYQRTKQLCKNLSEIQKLNIGDHHDVAVVNVEKRRFMFFIILLLTTPIFNIVELIIVQNDKTTEIDYSFFFRTIMYHLTFIVITTLEAQFVFTILSVHAELQALNRRLGNLLTDFKKNRERSNEILSAHKTLRKLATTYSSLCDIMRTLDKENGLTILIAFILLLIYAAQSTFFLVIFWNVIPIKNKYFTEIELDQLTVNRTMHCIRCLYAFIKIMFILEPCQWTYNEMEVTRLFVTRMSHYAPATSGPLVNELEMFYRLVFTNIPSYSPLQLFTLRRSFILEFTGALTTWFLIVLRGNRT